jgi:hypothetical protein
MAHAFKPSRLVRLIALFASLMAIGTTAAQAETGAYWEIGLTKEIKNFKPEVDATIDGIHIVLLTKVGLSKVEVDCTATRLSGTSLEKFGGFRGRIHYENCSTKLNGVTAGACKPHSPGSLEGLIETNLLDGLIVLHTGGVALLELLPLFGGPFVTVVMGKELGSECAIGSKFDITGKAFVKDGANEGSVNKLEHLVQEGPLSKLLFGGNAATIDGSAWVALVGEFLGSKWSGHPA